MGKLPTCPDLLLVCLNGSVIYDDDDDDDESMAVISITYTRVS